MNLQNLMLKTIITKDASSFSYYITVSSWPVYKFTVLLLGKLGYCELCKHLSPTVALILVFTVNYFVHDNMGLLNRIIISQISTHVNACVI